MFTKKNIEIIPAKTTASEVLASGYADFHVRVPIDAYEQAGNLMWRRMISSPDYEALFDDPAETRPTECELKARLAMFWALFCEIPMGVTEHLNWLTEYDGRSSDGQYVGTFVGAELLRGHHRLMCDCSTNQLREIKAVVAAKLEASEAQDREWEIAKQQAEQKRQRRKKKKAA